MKKTGLALAVVAALIVPATSPAEPSKTDTKAASDFCHDLIEASASKANLQALGHDNFGDCVSEVAKANAAARRAARREALRRARTSTAKRAATACARRRPRPGPSGRPSNRL